ncbi:MAG: M14 family zinc carboxypeptidase [Bacillota bacterium]|nr:M14 family zinc carboxypeptidase [Bacillota bacterium]
MYNSRILRYAYEDMETELRNLLYQYQGKVWLDSLGKSFDDREIYRIIAGKKNAEKKLLFTGAIHGREYITAKLLVKQTEYFLQNICKDRGEAFDVEIQVIPMVNPDGVALCHNGIEGIRKKELKEKLLEIREKEAFVRWKSNARGVDLNRNFDAFWKEYSCEKQKPSSEKYKGAYPESEVETRLLTKLTRKEKFQATVSYHSSGEVIYWDFGQQGKLREDTKRLAKIIGATTGYGLIEGGDKADPAGYKDWALLEMEIPSVTIEIGKGDSPLFEDEFPEIWEKNKNVWKNILCFM